MKKICLSILMTLIFISAICMVPASAQDDADPFYRVETMRLADGALVDQTVINSPPKPPAGYEQTRQTVSLRNVNQEAGALTLAVPAFDWSFGSSATSAAMIAAYYDRTGYENIYTGPTNGGVMPMESSVWSDWVDANGDTYGQCPLTASRQGLDGRAGRGSMDDYWVAYDSSSEDPYLTNEWIEHTWYDAISDYMKTSQSAYENADGSTYFYTWTDSPAQITCSQMLSMDLATSDGTYGRKLFYEARGYTVADCYNQKTDNNAGGFTFDLYKAEIDAGRPVLLNLAGHSIAGVGYEDPSTVFIHDTWDYNTHTMTWGGSYAGMVLQSVSIVNLLPPAAIGSLSGTVLNALTSTPIAGATVEALNSNQATAGAEGVYFLSIPAGIHSVTASASGYQTGTVTNVSISAGETTTLDFNLTPDASLSFDPQTMEATLNPGTSKNIQLTLTNNGGGEATFELQEQPGGFQPSQATNELDAAQAPAAAIPGARHAPERDGQRAQGSTVLSGEPLLYEGFEAGVVPPGGWSEVVSNHSYNWKIAIFGIPHSGEYAADVEYDDKNQDEWLLSPPLNLTQATLSFWSQGSVYWCRDVLDNCDLKAWIVVGDVGGGDDIYLGEADGDWPADWTWAQTTFDLTSFLPGGPVRIGFEYVGNDGAQIILDDITLDGTQGSMDIPWLSETPNAGTISATQSQIIDISFDASQVSQTGFYTGTLHILSNDSVNPDQSVAVIMHVTDQPVVTQVTPDHGPASGGTPVIVSGSNFKSGSSVTFGGAAASNIFVVSSSQITCSTPPHFPETVDLQVTNPDAQSATLLSGFTYESETASMSLPDTGGSQNETIRVPVNLANVQSLAAASFTVTFDNNILHANGVYLGDLTPGWSLAANTNNPGEVGISMASPGAMITGTGVLAMIDFEVVGAPGSSSELGLSSVLLNDGAIPVQTASGSFNVDLVYSISGTIQFWSGGVVSDTIMTLDGENLYNSMSGVDGNYQFSGAASGDYILTPEKTHETGGISSYDASLALQHDAGLITLSGHAATSADVNKNGVINSMDAFYILQKSVDLISLPFPGAGEIWSFSPPNHTYTGLSSDLTGQDFQAILLGDPSGNWTPEGFSQLIPTLSMSEAVSGTLSLPSVDVLPGETFTVPLRIDLSSGQVYGAEIEITHNSNVLTPTQILQGSLAAGWSIVSNLNNPGLIRVAMAGATPIVADGEMLKIIFDASDQAGLGTDLSFTKGELNEGNVTSALQSGHVYIANPVKADFSASPTSGPVALSVTFSNLSSGDFTTSLWNFGDGSTSTSTAPTYNYSVPGVYTVTLTVSGPGGNNTLVRSSYIHAYGLNVTGRAQYWASSAGLSGVELDLNGTNNYSTSTNSNGEFTISDILVGNYSLVPEKGSDTNGITAYDASLVLQHVAGLGSLTGHAASAADVDDSGSIGPMDSSYILRKAVGLIDVPFPGAASVWEFDPPNRNLLNLNTDRTGQDFIGVLLGDPSGNWQFGGLPPENSIQQVQAKLSVQSGLPDPTGRVTVSILLESADTQIYSLDLKLNYEPNKTQIISVDKGSILTEWMFAENVQQLGEIRVGLANSQPIDETGIVLTLAFQIEDLFSSTPLHFSEGLLNEGNVPVELQDGCLGGISLFLPLIIK